MAFLDNHKVTAEAPTATGTTTILSSAYDMGSYDGITFIVRLGSPAANNSIKVSQATSSGGSYADLTGTAVTHATNNQLMVSVYRPGKQFVKCNVVRGTTSTIDSLVAIQWKARGVKPVTQPTASTYEEWTAPAEGTA